MTDRNFNDQCMKKQRFWQVHIRAWERSGFSQNEYCRRNQLNSSQLRYWKKKLANDLKIPLKFVPVPVGNNNQEENIDGGDSGLHIIINNDIKIRLNNDFTPSTLAKVVTTLGAPS